jgi:hypothetical protein
MILRTTRVLGALAIVAVGAIHLQQYIGADYRTIPTIGRLFLLNAIASGIVGIGLLAPIRRVSAPRVADTVIGMLALAAVAIAIGSLVALFISESGGLFGFTESGYRAPIVVAIIAEAATIALLGPVATASLARAVSRRRDPTTPAHRPRSAARPHRSQVGLTGLEEGT